MLRVPAGEFTQGWTNPSNKEATLRGPGVKRVYLDAFFIDKTEVTVAAYGQCVSAGKCTKPATRGMDYNWGKPDRANHPVNGVNWSQAASYCRFLGKRLPTEAEWEKAARGRDGRKYPWGSAKPTCARAVMRQGQKPQGWGCGKKTTWPVGSKPAGTSPYGALDMAGNVVEWTADWYGKTYYASAPARNPRGPSSGSDRVVRGGGFDSASYDLEAYDRSYLPPQVDAAYIGFRCAKSSP